MRAQTLREENTALILKTILCADIPISRARISAETGLTKATVSRLTENLLNFNLIAEQSHSTPSGGRPSTPISAKNYTFFAVSLEININYLSMLVIDIAGNTVFHYKDTGNFRATLPQTVFGRLNNILNLWIPPKNGHIIGTSLIVPGLVDNIQKIIVTAPNLGWKNISPMHFLKLLPTFGNLILHNEANSAAYAQIFDRPGKQNKNTAFLYISSEVGIGSAIVLNGEIFGGKHSWAGEIGHICVDPAGPKCGCGANGCLEQYAGQDALFRRAGMPITSTLDDLIDSFNAGVPTAVSAIDNAATTLGRAIADTLNIIDVDHVILGGNFVRLLPCFQQLLISEIKYRRMSGKWTETEVIADKNNDKAALLGACFDNFAHFIDTPDKWNVN